MLDRRNCRWLGCHGRDRGTLQGHRFETNIEQDSYVLSERLSPGDSRLVLYPKDGEWFRGTLKGRGGTQQAHREEARPVMTIWALALPVPALLMAVHWYVPSSALEARGISQLLFPDSLQKQQTVWSL